MHFLGSPERVVDRGASCHPFELSQQPKAGLVRSIKILEQEARVTTCVPAFIGTRMCANVKLASSDGMMRIQRLQTD
jgi:hypothetical protein